MIKTYIVTGANRGLGYETALNLAQNHDHFVVMAGRDLEHTTASAQKIIDLTGNGQVLPLFIDLADLESVRQFVETLDQEEIRQVDGLICNAGITKDSITHRSAQGIELTFAVNHLSHFLLTNLLLDRLSGEGRVLIVSSNAHNPELGGGPIQPPRIVDLEWLAWPERDPELPANNGMAGGQAYSNSKLCNVWMGYELVRRLPDLRPDSKITVNVLAPGLMAGTGLGRDGKGITRLMWYVVLPLLSRFIPTAKSVEESGSNLAWLATSDTLAGVTGRYFFGRETMESSKASYDEMQARNLWEMSKKLVELVEQNPQA